MEAVEPGAGDTAVAERIEQGHLIDHAAARDIGFRCVWVDRGTGRKLLPDYVPDAIVGTLDEVPTLFDSLGW